MSSVTSVSIVLVVLFAVACDEPRSSPPPKTPATTIVVASPADAAAQTKAMPPLPLPPAIEAPAPVACRFAVPDYRSKTELWLGPEGQFFAFADGARDLDVTFSDTNLESVGFSFNGGTFTFRVTAHAGDLTFHPKKGRVWGGYLIPHADMAMRHSAFKAKKTSLEPSCPAVQSLSNLSEEATCDDVSLVPGSYDPMALVPGVKSGATRRESSLVLGRRIPLSLDPRGKPVANLDPDRYALTNVTVTGTQGDRSRIVWDADACVVFGWVATKDLRKGGMEAVPLKIPIEHQPELGPKEPVIESRKCAKAIPLVAQQMSQRATVGTVNAGGKIAIAEHQPDGWSRLAIPEAHVIDSADLFARTADVLTCDKL